MRFGNDEVKPNDMNEDQKLHAGKQDYRMQDDDATYKSACRYERNILYNCLNDNSTNIAQC